MSPLHCLVPALAVLSTFTSAALNAQSVATLSPDRDNTLYQEGFASNGAGTRMFAGFRLGGDLRRGVMHFDVAGAIPAGSSILSAELRFECVMTNAAAGTHELHAVTSDWGEGASLATGGQGGGGTPMANDTTWTERFYPGTLWTTPGGDFVPAVSSSTSVGAVGSYTFPSTATMVADAQSWLSTPATNFGWILIGVESSAASSTSRAFGTREDSANKPRLVITYCPPATATSFGASCAVSPPLVLGAAGLPTIGNAGFALTVSGGPATLTSKSGLFALGALGAGLPVLGCELWVDPALFVTSVPFAPNGTLGVSIANDPTLCGQLYYVQAAGIDLTLLQLVTSNGIALRIGV